MADLRKVGIQVVAEGAPESTQAVAAYDAALKGLDSTMQAVAQVAKLYGVSGSEAARLVNEQASQLGITVKQYADDLIVAAQDQQKLADQGSKTFSQLTKAEQDLLIATARDSKAYVDFWQNAFTEVAQAESSQGNANGGLDALQERLHALPEDFQQVALKLNASGISAANSLSAVEEALKNGVSAAELDEEATQALGEKMQANAEINAQYTQDLDENTAATEANSQAQQDLQDTAIKVGLAFFAMSIAARGLRDIGRELGIIYGQDVARGFSKAADALQTIGSFGSGGALIGSLFGPEGTIAGAGIGASLGLLSTLPALLDKTTQGTLALVDAADKLAHKDDAVTTLAALEGITQKDAQSALDAAKNNNLLADAINNVSKAQQHQEQTPQFINAGRGAQTENPEFKAAEDNAKVANEAFKAADALAQEAAAADKLHDANDKLIGQFQTENQFLEQSTGLTKSAIDAIKTYTSAHLGSGEALAVDLAALNELQTAQAKDTEHRSAYSAGIEDATNKVRKEADALNYEATILPQHTKMIEDAAKAEETYAKAVADANQKLNDASDKERQAFADAQTSYSDTVASASQTRDDAIFSAEQSLTDKISDLWQRLGNSIADINQGLADKIVDIQSKLADKIADIQTQLANKEADIQTQLADKIHTIEVDLQNRLNDLAHSHEQSIEAENAKIAQAARDLAEKLYQIERDRIEATNALDFNTHEQLENAQTQHDKNAILERHQFEQGQIDQKANDARRDAETGYVDKLAQIEKEKEAAKSEYDYEVALAKRLAQQKIDEANLVAAQQRAVAERDAQQQLAVAQRESQEAIAIANRQAQEQLAQAERQYEQEKEAAVRSYNEQVLAARKAEEQKLADAAKALTEKNKAIQASYDLEAKLIQRNEQLAYAAYIAQLKQIGEVALAYEMELKNLYENYTALGQKLFKSGLEDFTPLPPSLTTPPGGAMGLDLDVPAGHVGDTYMVGARSGEHVTISPPGYSSNTSNKSMNFYISGVTDPLAVRNEVARYISNEAWR